MAHTVRFTKEARNDLRSLHAYISKNDSQESADYVAREIVRAALALRDYPNRGAHPPELLRMGNRSYRQIFFKPYRILYRIRANIVYIAVIADGRRDMDSLLARRLH
jgi:toxin ParE1/3/4